MSVPAKTDITNKMERAKVSLVIQQPWFGMIALQMLEMVETKNVPTMGTDGTKLYYNPETVGKWSVPETVGVVAHEVLHCAMGHLWRRMGRDKWRWNVACDFAINPIVVGAGMKLPEGALLRKEYEGKSAEEIYRLLPDDLNKVGVGNEYTLNGDMLEPTSGSGNAAEKKLLEEAWKQAVRSATQAAQMQGKLPAGIERLVGEFLRPKCDWKSLLARFIQQQVKTDYSWTRPNRRFLCHGLWMPTLWSEACRPICVGIDTSGSIGNEDIKRFVSEVNGIIRQVQPERVHVLWADAEVAGVQTFERGEDFQPKPAGGGGTDFRPVFEWIDKHGEECACVIYITDGYGTFPEKAPEVPTLWVMTTDVVAPFGETIRLEAEEGA